MYPKIWFLGTERVSDGLVMSALKELLSAYKTDRYAKGM